MHFDRLPKPCDFEQGKRDLDEFGYCIHRDLLSAGRGGNTWIGTLRDPGGSAPWQAVRTLLNKGRGFIDLAMNPTILGYMSHGFRGMDFYLSSTNGLILRKGAVPMVTHSDQVYVPFQTAAPIVMNVMVCLSDFTDEMGATRVVPKSHLGPPPKLELDREHMDARNPEPIETVAAECEAGSAIVFEGRLWHCSGAHRSERMRYSVSTYYALPFVRPQDDYAASMHDDVYRSLSEAERAMFGFKAAPVGRIDPRFRGDRSNTGTSYPYIPELNERSTGAQLGK